MQRALPEVIVVAFGPVAHLRDALSGLDGRLVVHVVDNGASDEARELAQGLGFDYVRAPGNVGFAAAVNLGLVRTRSANDVLLLNPDARLDTEDVLRLQVALHAGPRTAAVAPLLQRPDGSREPTRWPFPTPALPWRGAAGRGSLRQDEPCFLSGAVLMLSGQALQQLGGLDERFFLYAEESDWQQRAVRAGWDVREVADVTAVHLGGATSSDSSARERHFHRSAELYVRKWYGAPGWYVFRAGSAVAALRRVLTARSPQARRTALLTLRLYVTGPSAAQR